MGRSEKTTDPPFNQYDSVPYNPSIQSQSSEYDEMQS